MPTAKLYSRPLKPFNFRLKYSSMSPKTSNTFTWIGLNGTPCTAVAEDSLRLQLYHYARGVANFRLQAYVCTCACMRARMCTTRHFVGFRIEGEINTDHCVQGVASDERRESGRGILFPDWERNGGKQTPGRFPFATWPGMEWRLGATRAKDP